jgi:hypothetical protein
MYARNDMVKRSVAMGAVAMAVVSSIFVFAGGGSAASSEERWGPRDPWLRPYDANSIWNTPIGTNASFVPTGYPVYEQGDADPVHLVRTVASDPIVPTREPHGWRDRCNSAAPETGELRIPRDFYVPDARQDSNGNWKTPNDNGVILDPDGRTLHSISTACRDENGPLHAWTVHTTDLYGDGIKGAHGASAMSALGGAIRGGELTGDAPIAHALSLVMYTKTAYMRGADTSTCYRWPASRCDAYAGRTGDDRYSGTNPDFRIGALLAIPSSVSCDELGLESAEGAKLCWTMQHYGGYFTEDSAWDANYVVVEEHTEDRERFTAAEVRRDLGRVIAAAQVVANNGPDNIGGGGAPLAPRHVNSWKTGAWGTESRHRVTTGGRSSLGVAPRAVGVSLAKPARLFGSRGGGALSGGSVTEVQVAGIAGLPANAAAAMLSVTVVDAPASGFVTIFPCGQPVPVTSNVNFSQGQTTDNSVFVEAGKGAKVCLYTSADTDLLVDATGYLPADVDVSLTDPARLFDSRSRKMFQAGSVNEVQVAGLAGLPTNTAAAMLNVTVVEAQASGFVTVFPCGRPVPVASNVRYLAGETIATSMLAEPGEDGKICIYSSAATHLVVDANGFVPMSRAKRSGLAGIGLPVPI